jgi:hypothetical protein
MNAEIGHRIPRYQFGFKEGHSTIHPLIPLTNNVQVNKLMGKKSAALFMDINKAFDSIWHKGLLYKMNMLNVPEYITHIIKNYLENRTSVIKINSATSEEFAPEQGVPQGSPLASLLYNMYCNDIYSEHEDDSSIERYIPLFADDTTIVTHERTLKATLEELKILTKRTIKWFHRWMLKSNPTKSKFMVQH